MTFFATRDLALAALSDALLRLAAKCPACEGGLLPGTVPRMVPGHEIGSGYARVMVNEPCAACAGTGDVRGIPHN